MKKTYLALVLIAALALGAAGGAWAQEITSLEEVASQPTGNNAAEAQKRAVAQALNAAVGRAALNLLDPATRREQLKTLATKILARAGSFVSNYSPMAVTEADGRTVVLVSVTIDEGALKKALAEAALRLPTGRIGSILVMVSEEASPGRPPVYWWSGSPGAPAAPAVVAKVLASLGGQIVDPFKTPAILPNEAKPLSMGPQDAAGLGSKAGAGLVIMGRLRTYPLVTNEDQNPMPLAFFQAVDVSGQRVLAEISEQGPIFHAPPGPAGDKQVSAALQGAVRRLLEKVAANLPQAVTQSGNLTLTVSGLKSLRQLMAFERVLAGMKPLVGDLSRDSVTAGRATFKVSLSGPASKLADELTIKDFGGFLVNVVAQEPGILTVVAVPKQEPTQTGQ